MITKVLNLFLGDKHERETKKLRPLVAQINEIYKDLEKLSDEELLARSLALKERLSSIEDSDEQDKAVDEAVPEAYAMVKDACRRNLGREISVVDQKSTWDMVPYDVQMIGAIVLNQGKIAEMATGEGKTLVAVMPLYLNALKGKGAHLVTVNDYLARRDSEWMGTIFRFLGLSVGCIQHDIDPPERKKAYDCDITYGTNNEFGFDYLRDNMTFRLADRVQRGFHYAIVDEVDSVLIDEARTPLIISGPVQGTGPRYDQFKPMVESLFRSQTALVNKEIARAQELLEEADKTEDDKKRLELNYEAGKLLLRASRGTPKNKRLLKLISNEMGIKKLINKVEADVMREKKMPELDEGLYFAMDEKGNQVQFSEKGHDLLSPKDPEMFIIPDLSYELDLIDKNEALSPQQKAEKIQKIERDYLDKSEKIHTLQQLLKAYCLFEKDVEYVVQDGKVMIVDEFTGRLMPGRRFSDGLHQALEAKENVKIEGETQTLATITLQNFFRMYERLAGMTGTAETEAGEFYEIYKLDVIVVPTNKPIDRDDRDDLIYKTRREKFNAIIDEIARVHAEGQPILVGTVSVEVSETLSRMLKRRGIGHHVLNAKYHQQEAQIVADAGKRGSVTIATNMAGRGTDIKLGGEVPGLGGLYILGTERHESRRIDRQLRGRAGRQGDPGCSVFFLSLEDDLMRLFGSDRISSIMDRLGLEEGEVITHPLVSQSISRAQKKVEGNNFQIRKHLLEYDDVMNQQREVIYNLRLAALEGHDEVENDFMEMMEEAIEMKVAKHIVEGTSPEDWDLEGLSRELLRSYLVNINIERENLDELSYDSLKDKIREIVFKVFEMKCEEFGEERKRFLIQHIMLRVLDEHWREHLYTLDHLKSGINFRAYGQKDPLIEYKKEAFNEFLILMDKIKEEVTNLFFKAQFIDESEIERRARDNRQVAVKHATISAFEGSGEAQVANQPEAHSTVKTVRNEQPKIGRNDPCYCGSGKKFKHCHGRED